MSITIERPSTTPGWFPTVQFSYEHRFQPVHGGRMHYVDVGRGEAILFLHGLPTWSYLYRHLIRGLCDSYRCIAPDFIGFGLSDKPAEWGYSPMDQLANLTAFIDELGLDQITLVMHDYGVAIGTAYAVEHPSKIKRMVVMNGACWDLADEPGPDKVAKAAAGPCGWMLQVKMNAWSKMIRAGFADKARCSESFDRAMSGPTLNKEDRIGMWKTAKALATSGPFFDDIWRRRRELCDISIQFIWGMKDPCYVEKILNKWWHEFPLCPVERLSSCGHFPTEEKPAEVLQIMQQFLTTSLSAPYLA